MNTLVASLGAACLLLLGACNNQAAGQDNATAPAEENDYQARVAALSQGERDEVLFKAIRDAGRACPNIEDSTRIAPVKGAPAWKAVCDNGAEWIVIVGETGIAVVTSEAELRANGLATNAGR